jgi:hypothetical protein
MNDTTFTAEITKLVRANDNGEIDHKEYIAALQSLVAKFRE